jgi:hypothetical protein
MKRIKERLQGYLASLRFPWLLLLVVLLFLIDVFVPDAFPFVDEILLALVAALLARLKRRGAEDQQS